MQITKCRVRRYGLYDPTRQKYVALQSGGLPLAWDAVYVDDPIQAAHYETKQLAQDYVKAFDELKGCKVYTLVLRGHVVI